MTSASNARCLEGDAAQRDACCVQPEALPCCRWEGEDQVNCLLAHREAPLPVALDRSAARSPRNEQATCRRRDLARWPGRQCMMTWLSSAGSKGEAWHAAQSACCRLSMRPAHCNPHLCRVSHANATHTFGCCKLLDLPHNPQG